METIRARFAFIGEPDELEECIHYIRGFAEEAMLSHTKICVEIHVDKRLPQNVQTPVMKQTC
jgi:hypothetical protein